MILLTCLCANPPMLGHAFLITMCGYVFGFPRGCLPAACGTFLGGMLTFTLVRKLKVGRFARIMSIRKQETFDAMSMAISQGGFRIAFLIRICPLPWQISSSILSLCDAVSFKTYGLAAFLASFKTGVEVWIGSQLATLTDGTLPPEAHKVALITMGVGMTILVVVALWLYRLTMKQVQEAQGNTDVARPDEQMALLCNYQEPNDVSNLTVKISTIA
ncbi:hypothetical protein [Parasitella parasitica]|uniref:Golgi apparatus membrane protein TVP38 n=1 Tax=Parasitella parasitica TaxID=35722 RepID=A0A0B7NU20_9FUNG|nr:hypothetical protein [Parasitella parasitica]